MVAVFGAMSLTNPAFADVNSPADSQLAEGLLARRCAGQWMRMEITVVYEGDGAELDITPRSPVAGFN